MTVPDGYEIAGVRATDSVLHPWSIGSLARALYFYAQAQEDADRRGSSAVAVYYSLFHLGMFLLFGCPHYQNNELKSAIQAGVKDGCDPSKKVSHKALGRFLRRGVEHGLPPGVCAVFEQAGTLRDFINYGPRVMLIEGNEMYVDTCSCQAGETQELRVQLPIVFHQALGWACANGPDGGVWVPTAASQVQAFFTGPSRLYGAWCTDQEAEVAEVLRTALEDDARRTVFGHDVLLDS